MFRGNSTGAKRGDFRLQTAVIGSVELRADGKKSSTYPFRRPLPRLGSGMGSCFHFLPRRLQYLRQDIFNRLRQNLQSLKTGSVRLWDVVFPHQFNLISGDQRVGRVSETNPMTCHKLNGNRTRNGRVPALAAMVLSNSCKYKRAAQPAHTAGALSCPQYMNY